MLAAIVFVYVSLKRRTRHRTAIATTTPTNRIRTCRTGEPANTLFTVLDIKIACAMLAAETRSIKMVFTITSRLISDT